MGNKEYVLADDLAPLSPLLFDTPMMYQALMHQPDLLRTDDKVDGLINDGYHCLRRTWAHIGELQDLIDEQADKPDFTNVRANRHPERENPSEDNKEKKQSRTPEQEKGKKSRTPEQEKGTKEPEQKRGEKKDDFDLNDPQLLRNFYRMEALRPIGIPAPGRMPFRHDQIRRLEKYREGWAALPVPGNPKHEQEMARLRWRIRDLMAKRDIPHLKLVQLPPPKQRKEWMR